MLPTTRSANTVLIQTIAIACAAACSIQVANADSWNYKANASASWLYNDNPTLRPSDSPLKRDATSYGRVQAKGIVEHETARSFIDLASQISTSYYPKEEDSDLEQVNFYFLSNSTYDLQRSGVNMLLKYDNVGLLTDEFGDGVDNGPGGSGSGSTFRTDDRVQRFDIAPNYDYQLSNKDLLSVGVNYRAIDYKLEKTRRADSTIKGAQLTYTRSLNQRWQMGITASGRKFRSDKLAPIVQIDLDLINRSESKGLSLNINYQWHVNGGINLSVGRTNTSNERTILLSSDPNAPQTSTAESDIVNTIYNLSIYHSGQRNKYNLTLSRGIVPSSLGVENTQTTINASFQRRILERVTGTLSLNGYDQEASINTDESRFNNTYRFLSANATLSWRIARSWSISGVYTFRQNASTTGGSTSQRGKSNQLGATLTYNWD